MKIKKTKHTIRTGTESEKWTSHGGFSVGKGRGTIGGEREEEAEGAGNKKHNW